MLLDELQRLEGQYVLDILCRENSVPIRVCSSSPRVPCVPRSSAGLGVEGKG